MKLGNEKGIKTGQWFSNEILRMDDINYVGEGSYQNFTDLIAVLAEQGVASGSTKDTVLAGCLLEWNNLLTCDLRAGAVVSFQGYYMASDGTWGWQSSSGDVFGVYIPKDTVVAFDTGGASDRIDTLEVRPIQEDYNSQSRQFKDPITGAITSAVIDTRTHYGFEFQILKGTGGAGVAPTHTAGWIKIAEVEVDASATVIVQADITDIRDSDLWTIEANNTLYKKSFIGEKVTSSPTGGTATSLDREDTVGSSFNEILARLRDLSGVQNDAVKERHIDWGTSAGQIKAESLPIADAKGKYTTDNTEKALEEIQATHLVAKAANYTITDTDGISVIDMTTGATNKTATLPTASDNINREITLRKADSGIGKAILDGEGAETINGTLTWEVTEQYGYVKVKSNGTSWIVLTKEGCIYEMWETTSQVLSTSWVDYYNLPNIVPGVYKIEYGVTINVGTTAEKGYVTLATAVDTEDDEKYTMISLIAGTSTGLAMQNYKSFRRSFAGATTLYLNAKKDGVNSVNIRNDIGYGSGYIRATRIG